MPAAVPVRLEDQPDTILEALRVRARKWLSSVEIPRVPFKLEERFVVLRKWQRTLFDAGWMGLGWSREAGGQGLTERHQFLFAEELARAHAPAPIGLIGLDVIGPTIHAFGTPEQRARDLPPLLAGDEIWELVHFGKQATHLLFTVADGNGEALLLLSADDPAITIIDLPSSDPTVHYAQVKVDGRTIQPDEYIARDKEAHRLLTRIRSWFRVYTACELAGIARRVLADTVAYTSERQQFGRPVGSFQALKHLIAGMAQRALSLEAYCEAVMADADAQSLVDFELSAWSLKAYAESTARKVCEDALQAHGGIGFTIEYDLHWFLRRALALRTWYGEKYELARLIGSSRLAQTELRAA